MLSVNMVLTAAQGYTVFAIPLGVVYRPTEAKVRNLKTKDYLGRARLVAASDRSNALSGFAGFEIKSVCSTCIFWRLFLELTPVVGGKERSKGRSASR